MQRSSRGCSVTLPEGVMKKTLLRAVNDMNHILMSFNEKLINEVVLRTFVNLCARIAKNSPPTIVAHITKLIELEYMPEQQEENSLWEEASLFNFYLVRYSFEQAGINFHPELFKKIYTLSVAMLPENEANPLLISIPSHILYEKLAMAVATGKKGSFTSENSDKWPTHHVIEKSLSANFLMRPSFDRPLSLIESSPGYTSLLQLMQTRLTHLDELTMDVMHIICARWLEANPSTSTEQIRLTADDILEARGLKRHLNADGRRGGFTREQRDSIHLRMAALSSLWVSVNDMRITVLESGKRVRKSTRYESPALVITGRFGEISEDGDVDLWTWNVRPGDVFSAFLLDPASREIGLFPEKSLTYDPIRQSWEKKLSFYLSWQWRIQRSKGYFKPYKVQTLLNAIHEEIDTAHPVRTRERLEKALDTLEEDKLIQKWQYGRSCHEEELPLKGWHSAWLNWNINIKPTKQIITPILQNEDPKENQLSLFNISDEIPTKDDPNADNCEQKSIASCPPDYAETLKSLRATAGLSQGQAAAKLGVARTLINQVESGKKTASAALILKIEKWAKNP